MYVIRCHCLADNLILCWLFICWGSLVRPLGHMLFWKTDPPPSGPNSCMCCIVIGCLCSSNKLHVCFLAYGLWLFIELGTVLWHTAFWVFVVLLFVDGVGGFFDGSLANMHFCKCATENNDPKCYTRSCLQLFLCSVPNCEFGCQTERQGRYSFKNTCKFDVLATRIQWKTSRTKIRPTSRKNKIYCVLLTRTILGMVAENLLQTSCFGSIRLLVNYWSGMHPNRTN